MKLGVGGKIKQQRLKSGMTQEILAHKLGVSRQTISKWENGRTLPDIDCLIQICDIFNTNLEELLRDIKEKKDGKDGILAKRFRKQQYMLLVLIVILFGSAFFYIGENAKYMKLLDELEYQLSALDIYHNKDINTKEYDDNKVEYNGQVIDNRVQNKFEEPVHDLKKYADVYNSDYDHIQEDGIMFDIVGMQRQENGSYIIYYKKADSYRDNNYSTELIQNVNLISSKKNVI